MRDRGRQNARLSGYVAQSAHCTTRLKLTSPDFLPSRWASGFTHRPPTRNVVPAGIAVQTPSGDLLFRQYSFYGSTEYNYALGSATLFHHNGRTVGFFDTYDFNHRAGGRTAGSQFITQAIGALSPAFSKAFNITYGWYEAM